ncbi:uncharacterized protein LOC133884012 [Phragmites australis]|uniref:uncharacterized protein LOC133884012 n=1 Tax=Phragmites australis TaxID=29695 RepID=UPI002D77B525|nr:uncharacterized protein LOC133884012 [Phragmites australis]
MPGEDERTPPQSPRSKALLQHFERKVRLHAEHLDEDVRVTNERLGQLEATQINTNTRLTALEGTLGALNTSLVGILERLDRMGRKGHDGSGRRNNNNTDSSVAGHDEEEYSADTEHDGEVNDQRRHQQRRHRHGTRARQPRREVRDNDDPLGKIKFSMPSFDGKYGPNAYLTWELAVDQKFACHDFPENKRVRAATSEFTDFASIWWSEYIRSHQNNTPQTWEAMKRIMRAKFVPSYHTRDLLHKLQLLRQGNKSVEEYYQELQTGMLRCGLVENEDAAMARFMGGLNREIQDILAYKEYNSITRLFHLACKAEREVQGRRASTRTNISAANNAGGDGEHNQDEEHIGTEHAEHYESLVVQRVLSAQMEKAEQNQRHTLFQTKCVIKERSCRVIIDGGSCNNLASAEMVEKLALSTWPHPQPYYIQWLNSSGRPWQFDIDSLHHGKANQYSFMHNGKKFVLHPMSPEAILKDELTRASKLKNQKHAKSENQIVANELEKHKTKNAKSVHDTKNEIKLKGSCFIATKSDLDEINATTAEYADIFPKEVPSGLPPIRGIEHQIDLIPGASLPNPNH